MNTYMEIGMKAEIVISDIDIEDRERKELNIPKYWLLSFPERAEKGAPNGVMIGLDESMPVVMSGFNPYSADGAGYAFSQKSVDIPEDVMKAAENLARLTAQSSASSPEEQAQATQDLLIAIRKYKLAEKILVELSKC